MSTLAVYDLAENSREFFKQLNYPIEEMEAINKDYNINEFLIYNNPKRLLFNNLEDSFLKKIDRIGYIFTLNFENKKRNIEKIIFLYVDLAKESRDRDENAFFITKILNKLYDENIIIFFRCDNVYCLTTPEIKDENVILGRWIDLYTDDVEDSIYIFSIDFCNLSNFNSYEFLCDFSYAIASEESKYELSYEYLAFECFEFDIDIGENTFASKQKVDEHILKVKEKLDQVQKDNMRLKSIEFTLMGEDDIWDHLEFDEEELREIDLLEESNNDEICGEDTDDNFENYYTDEIMKNPIKVLNQIKKEEL